ncbi:MULTISPECIES: hypothetical protein [unclassified Streptomyces]|uniref:hypothetical protein n=1 Tax=unclassified Streptomyces TaxID=2593676 RepID=UPI0036EBA62D
MNEAKRLVGWCPMGEVRQAGFEGRHQLAVEGIADPAEPLGAAVDRKRPPPPGQRREVAGCMGVELLQRIRPTRHRARPDDGAGRNRQKAPLDQAGNDRFVFPVQELKLTDVVFFVPDQQLMCRRASQRDNMLLLGT